MKYIVTGGAGFIGSNLVDDLLNDNHTVHVIDNFSTGKKENCNPKAIYHEYDISDFSISNELIEIMENCDGLFHTAALARVQQSIENPIKYETVNTFGTLNILKCAADAKLRRVVYSASSSAYGNKKEMPCKETDQINPISPYANQKYYGEVQARMFAELFNIETVSLRYFNVYGERQNIDGAYATVMGIFAHQKMNNLPMTVRGDGKQRRDFTYVGDIVSANRLAMTSEDVGRGEVINIGSGKNFSVNQIAEMMEGRTTFVDPVVEPRESLASIEKAKKLLNWQPNQTVEEWIPKYKKQLGI